MIALLVGLVRKKGKKKKKRENSVESPKKNVCGVDCWRRGRLGLVLLASTRLSGGGRRKEAVQRARAAQLSGVRGGGVGSSSVCTGGTAGRRKEDRRRGRRRASIHRSCGGWCGWEVSSRLNAALLVGLHPLWGRPSTPPPPRLGPLCLPSSSWPLGTCRSR